MVAEVASGLAAGVLPALGLVCEVVTACPFVLRAKNNQRAVRNSPFRRISFMVLPFAVPALHPLPRVRPRSLTRPHGIAGGLECWSERRDMPPVRGGDPRATAAPDE